MLFEKLFKEQPGYYVQAPNREVWIYCSDTKALSDFAYRSYDDDTSEEPTVETIKSHLADGGFTVFTDLEQIRSQTAQYLKSCKVVYMPLLVYHQPRGDDFVQSDVIDDYRLSEIIK